MTAKENKLKYDLLFDYECLINEVESVANVLNCWDESDSRDGIAVCVYALRGLVSSHGEKRADHRNKLLEQ